MMNNFDACNQSYLFPGQSAQSTEMLDEFQSSNTYRSCLDIITNLLGENPEKYLEVEGYIHKNEIASLLTVMSSVCSLNTLDKNNKPYAYAGYSVGQYTAMYAAGLLNLENLFELVFKRANFMNTCAQKTKSLMFAVIGLTDEKINEVCESINSSKVKIYISNFNCLGQVTLAANQLGYEKACAAFKKCSARKVVLLPSEGGWHSPFMEDAEHLFHTEISHRDYFQNTNNRVICNRHGDILPTADKETMQQCLSEHISKPVLWESGIKTLILNGVTEFIEVGYGNTLTKFGFFIDRKLKHLHYKKIQ